MLSWRHVYLASSRYFPATIWLVAFLFVRMASAQPATLDIDCAPTIFVESTGGIVTVTKSGVALSASRNMWLCPGDEIVTGPNGRATIRFVGERQAVIRLNNNSKLRVRLAGPDDPPSKCRQEFCVERRFGNTILDIFHLLYVQ